MPTVIDVLIVELGLDPRGFTKGQKDLVQDLRRTEGEAARSAKTLEAQGKRAGSFFKEIRGQAVALFAVLTSGKALADFARDTARQDAATGRLAHSLGQATSELGNWQRVAVRTGGTAEGITQSLSGIVDQFQQIQLTGTSSAAPYLQALGLKREDLNDASESLLKISDAFAKMDPRRARAFGQALGFDNETISLLQRGRPAVQAMLDAEKRRGGVSDESAKKTAALNAQLADLKANSDEAGREILISAAPAITTFLGLLNGVLQAAPGVTKAIWGITAAVSALSVVKVGAGALGLLSKIFPAAAAGAEAAAAGEVAGGLAGAGGGKLAAGAAERAAARAAAAAAPRFVATSGLGIAGAAVGGVALSLIPTEANKGEAADLAKARAAMAAAKASAPQDKTLGAQTKDFIQAREGFTTKAYWDRNAYRVGHGSDTITDAQGRVSRVTKDTAGVTKEMAGRDLERRIQAEFLPRARAAAGEAWDTLNDATKVALTSVAYNYGSLPKDIAKAAQSGNQEAIAAAIRNHSGDNEGVNAGRRGLEADSILKGLRTGSRAAQQGPGAPTPVAGGGDTHIGTITVVTQATDAKGIARDIGPAVKSQGLATQAQSGLR